MSPRWDVPAGDRDSSRGSAVAAAMSPRGAGDAPSTELGSSTPVPHRDGDKKPGGDIV